MAYEESESARDNFGYFIKQLQTKTKTFASKLESIQIKLYRQNMSLLFNQTFTIYIYIYISFIGIKLKIKFLLKQINKYGSSSTAVISTHTY